MKASVVKGRWCARGLGPDLGDERIPTKRAVGQRQASAGARDGVKGQRRTLAARAPLHALVRRALDVGAIAQAYFSADDPLHHSDGTPALRKIANEVQNSVAHDEEHDRRQRYAAIANREVPQDEESREQCCDNDWLHRRCDNDMRPGGQGYEPALHAREVGVPPKDVANEAEPSLSDRTRERGLGFAAEPINDLAHGERCLESKAIVRKEEHGRLWAEPYEATNAERQASAGARDGVKGKRNDLGARAPLHALVGLR